MRQQVVPGGHIDALTGEEAAAAAERFAEVFKETPGERIRATETALLDATGAGTVTAYQVPVGMEFRLTRLLVRAEDGSSFAAPFKNPAGSVEIRRSGVLVDGVNLGSAGLPVVWTESSAAAPIFRNGETVDIVLAGGPASVLALASVEGDLYPARKGEGS